ncbi:terpene synthase family protein [Algoriphagus sp. D3-2-R+10]|uniref:terpene synthase family protein n=1 Tax=Algoriphagus aurantiacus TaxID=3103948 RepID=UPI002B3BD27E|nr:terpene synthase family protein [Algoriphagus sp. D3-2-R+10]MEB2778492.1 terpene synthase family protein [Algoriphagus sp. D3-2-R+10]
MMTYSFPSALNIHTLSLDRDTCQWAIIEGVLDPIQLSVWADQKINWFAGYLFPRMSAFKLEKVMKLFCCLFILDDLMDTLPSNQSLELLEKLLPTQNEKVSDHKLSPLPRVLNDIVCHVSTFGDTAWGFTFQNYWYRYIDAQKWEVLNKQSGVLPSFPEYKERRMDSSGVYIALHLLKDTWKSDSCAVRLLDYKVARIICLSNDVISMDKERDAGDFHNELLLLQHYTGCSSGLLTAYADNQLKRLVSEVVVLMDTGDFQDAEVQDGTKTYIEELKLLVGGCHYWSQQDTLRYGASINGCLQKN